jgi:heat shock protein HtpX
MKRIVLFLLTNLAVMLVISVIVQLFGLNQWMSASGLNLGGLLVFSAVVGFSGAIISLLISKMVAKWSTGAVVINGSEGPEQRWLVDTVYQYADKAGIGRPEVAIYEGDPNAFATGAF